jgi:hypothetical protein
MIGLGLGIPEIAVRGSGLPPWLLAPGGIIPDVDIDFANGRAWTKTKGLILPASLLTVTRASQETIVDLSGNVTYAPNGSGVGGGLGAALSNAGLQAWEARTNQQTYSAVNTTGWSTNNATLNGASAVSPDGTTNAATITDNAASGIHGIYQQSQAVTASQTQTSSIFLKQGTIRYAEFLCYDTSGNGVVIFVDTQLGVLSGSGTIGAGATYVSSKIEPYANRWWRVSLVGTMTADTHLFQDVRMSPDGSTTFYVGTGSTLFAWGAQLEQATFASPLIPTTSGTAARAADVIKLTTPPVFGSAYSMVAWGTPAAPTAFGTNQGALIIGDGSTANRYALSRNSSTGLPSAFIFSGGSNEGGPQSGSLWGQLTSGKLATSFSVSAATLVFNAGSPVVSSGIAAPAIVNTVGIGNTNFAGNQFNGTISRVALWPTTALSTGALQQVTT